MRQPPDVFKWPLNVVVVRSGGRTVLIDAGIGAELPADFPRAAGLLAGRLKAAGIDPASVSDVVLTHMHVDHVGGLLANGLRGGLRPDVPIHLAAAEVAFWASPHSSATLLRGCRRCFGRSLGGSRTSTAARCGRSRRSTLRPGRARVALGPDRHWTKVQLRFGLPSV